MEIYAQLKRDGKEEFSSCRLAYVPGGSEDPLVKLAFETIGEMDKQSRVGSFAIEGQLREAVRRRLNISGRSFEFWAPYSSNSARILIVVDRRLNEKENTFDIHYSIDLYRLSQNEDSQ